MAKSFAQRVIPMLSYEDAGRAADWIAGQRQYRAEDVEGHRWMFAERSGD